MKNQLRGIAILLLSILLMMGFSSAGWKYVFDLSLMWPEVFMVLGAAGAALAFWPDKGEK